MLRRTSLWASSASGTRRVLTRGVASVSATVTALQLFGFVACSGSGQEDKADMSALNPDGEDTQSMASATNGSDEEDPAPNNTAPSTPANPPVAVPNPNIPVPVVVTEPTDPAASNPSSDPTDSVSAGGGTSTSPGEGGNGGEEMMSNPVGGAGSEMGGTGGDSVGGGDTGASGGGASGATSTPTELPLFSFFVTSLAALQDLSGSPDGFGGDLRYGEADGLSGADKICSEIAERSMSGASAKQWRAFLSTTAGGSDGGPVHAIDRIGEGPWYDRLGRVVAMTREDLLNQRPNGADPEIINDLPNEDGVPNHAPEGELVDNHDMLTGTNDMGQLYTGLENPLDSTCNDWTSAEPMGNPRVGHPWPTGGGFDIAQQQQGGGFGGIGDLANWMSALDEAGCAPGVFIVEMGPPMANNPTVGSGGGYGGFYCFALTP
jgi:hypothetical protein